MKSSIFFSALLLLGGCSTEHPPTQEPIDLESPVQEKHMCTVESNRVQLLAYESWLGLEGIVADTMNPPSHLEIEMTECALIPLVQEWNSRYPDTDQRHVDVLLNYNRQYAALKDARNHRVLYLSAFCSDLPFPEGKIGSWDRTADGGGCYFQFLFDLTAGNALSFNVNGLG